jgi:hypothetical protein
MSSDDYFAIDGTTLSTRKMSAATPAFTTVLTGNGTVAAPSVSFASDQDTGLYRITANTIGVAANGVLRARIDPDGFTSLGLNNQIQTTDYNSSTSTGSTMQMALLSGTGDTSGKLEVYKTGGAAGGVLNINTSGGGAVNFGSGTATFAGAATIAGTVIHTLSATPATSTATGTVGTISWDSGYIYICTSANTWKRVAIGSW